MTAAAAFPLTLKEPAAAGATVFAAVFAAVFVARLAAAVVDKYAPVLKVVSPKALVIGLIADPTADIPSLT